MTSFIPSQNPNAADGTIANDGWYPDLDIAAFMACTETGQVFAAARVIATLQAAMIEINASVAAWRAKQTAGSLAEVPAPAYGGQSEKIILYTQAVFARARAEMLRTVRDYDSTKDGHDRADKLEDVAGDYSRQSAEALARLTGRPRMVVELI